MELLLLVAAVLGVVTSVSAAPTTWVNSTVGVHTFLTFDYLMSPATPAANLTNYDFVWGASGSTVADFRQKSPNTVFSFYMTFNRDFVGKPLAWWQTRHPECVLYKCDRVTPAYQCYGGENPPCSPLVTLDLDQPYTLQFQIKYGLMPASKLKYDAIALDNYGFVNWFGACGSYSGPNGTWVTKYNPSQPGDPAFGASVINWTARFVSAAKRLSFLVIPNFQPYLSWWEQPNILAMTNLTDGVLAEGGFLYWGPSNAWNWTGRPYMDAENFESLLLFMRNQQLHGKAYYLIDEWGPGPNYNSNPQAIPYNISGSENRWIRQFSVASYLLGAGNASGMYLVCIQCYGNLSWWPEYDAPVGSPLGEPTKNTTTGVWSRLFTNAVVFVNPHSATLPPPLQHNATACLAAGFTYTDLYGESYPAGCFLVLPPTTGIVLLRTASAGEEERSQLL